MNYLSPSLLSADFSRLEEQIRLLDEAGAHSLHLDVMDGRFVPAISFGQPVIKSIRSCTDLIFDVHLMVEEPVRYIPEFAAAGADIITVHAESCIHLDRTVQAIKDLGKKAGAALNPATPLSVLDYILPQLDMVLLMSVNPGFSGQKYIPYATEKIRNLKRMADSRNLDTHIEVDGGVTLENLNEVLDAGADVIVSGNSVFSGDIRKNVNNFLEIMK